MTEIAVCSVYFCKWMPNNLTLLCFRVDNVEEIPALVTQAAFHATKLLLALICQPNNIHIYSVGEFYIIKLNIYSHIKKPYGSKKARPLF